MECLICWLGIIKFEVFTCNSFVLINFSSLFSIYIRYIEVFRSNGYEYHNVMLGNDGPPFRPPYEFDNFGPPPWDPYYNDGLLGPRPPPPPSGLLYPPGPPRGYGPPPPPDWEYQMDRRPPYEDFHGPPREPIPPSYGYRSPPPPPQRGSHYGPMKSNRMSHFNGPNKPYDRFGPANDRFHYYRQPPSPPSSRNGGPIIPNRPISPIQQSGMYNSPIPKQSSSTSSSHIIFVRDLPSHIFEADLMRFFDSPGINVKPINVRLMKGDYGQPTEAKVEFASHQDAIKAMEKDKAILCMFIISCFLNCFLIFFLFYI